MFTVFTTSAAFAVEKSDAPTSYGKADHTFGTWHRLGATNDDDGTTSILNANATDDGSQDYGVTLPTITQGASATINVAISAMSIFEYLVF